MKGGLNMDDKVIANDCLESAKVACTEITKAIAECGNQQLRQTLTQLRNQAEQSQQQIAQIAQQQNWYPAAGPASPDEVSHVRSFFEGGAGTVTGTYPGAQTTGQTFGQTAGQTTGQTTGQFDYSTRRR